MTQDGSGDPSGKQDGFSCCGCLAMVFASAVLVLGGLSYTFFEVLLYGFLSLDIPFAVEWLREGLWGGATVALVVIAILVAVVALIALVLLLIGAVG